jgi:Sec-independent protein secretion pathway component TatC
MAIPLIILYEVGAQIARFVGKRGTPATAVTPPPPPTAPTPPEPKAA